MFMIMSMFLMVVVIMGVIVIMIVTVTGMVLFRVLLEDDTLNPGNHPIG